MNMCEELERQKRRCLDNDRQLENHRTEIQDHTSFCEQSSYAQSTLIAQNAMNDRDLAEYRTRKRTINCKYLCADRYRLEGWKETFLK